MWNFKIGSSGRNIAIWGFLFIQVLQLYFYRNKGHLPDWQIYLLLLTIIGILIYYIWYGLSSKSTGLRIFMGIVAASVVGIVMWLFVLKDPFFNLTSPTDGQVIEGNDNKVSVVGKTDWLSKVKVNGAEVPVNSDGIFYAEVPLNEGENNITIVSSNFGRRTSSATRKIIYRP